MIKEINEEVSSNKKYEVYEEVSMNTPDGKTVKVLSLKETVFLDQLNNEITQLGNEITSLEARLASRQLLLAEINNL